MRLLYAEDEPAMSEAVVDILTYHGYQVDAVSCGDDALDYAQLTLYDGIILDIMLPGMSGLDVLRALRKHGLGTPVLILTAKDEVNDRIIGLESGADDYLGKPFAMGELLARVRAMLRRREVYTPDELACGNIKLNTAHKTLESAICKIDLSRIEYQMMEFFMLNQGTYLSSEQLLEHVWGCEKEVEQGALWVYISYLRKKLQQLEANVEICTKRGIGYALEVI